MLENSIAFNSVRDTPKRLLKSLAFMRKIAWRLYGMGFSSALAILLTEEVLEYAKRVYGEDDYELSRFYMQGAILLTTRDDQRAIGLHYLDWVVALGKVFYEKTGTFPPHYGSCLAMNVHMSRICMQDAALMHRKLVAGQKARALLRRLRGRQQRSCASGSNKK